MHHVLVALLGKRRHLGHEAAALGSTRAQHAHLAAVDVLQHVAQRAGDRSNVAAHHVHQRRLRAAVADVFELDPTLQAQQGADKVRRRTRGWRAKGTAIGVGFDPGKELRHGGHAGRHHGADGKTELKHAAQRDGTQVRHRVVAELFVDVRINRQHRRGRLQHGCTIGWLALDVVDGDLSACAGAVFHHRGFGIARQFGRHTAANCIRGATCGKAGDDVQALDLRLCIGLRAEAREQGGGAGSTGGLQNLTAVHAHEISPQWNCFFQTESKTKLL